jgi:hypothetical protein
MSWVITPALKTLAGTKGAISQASILGLPIDGGYFAGYISHTQDGNPTHALIVAPAATGASGTGYSITTNLQWKTTATSTTGTDSVFDGFANSQAMNNATHPAAQFCRSLTIEGFSDWYLPAKDELEIAYFNLKPTTQSNVTGQATNINPYSVPLRTVNYTTTNPAQTLVLLFQSGGQEAFSTNNHWASTQFGVNVWYKLFSIGNQASNGNKTVETVSVRAFRRIAL